MNEWIIAIGKHEGTVPSKQWIKVQESLDRNKAKSYRKPRNNEALLTGLLFCSCGERMYPKLSKRQTADGKPIYTYVCKMKERSKRERCNRRNANGNVLDVAIIEQIKTLTEHESSFLSQMSKSRKFFTGNREQYEAQLVDLQAQYAENEKNINGLMDTLSMAADSIAKPRILRRIGDLTQANREVEIRIHELEGLISSQSLSDMEFDILRQMLAMFKTSIDDMSVEEKRQAIRTVVRKVIWDGVNAHVVLFGADEGEIELPDMNERLAHIDAESSEEEPLEAFADVDYEEFEEENDCLGKPEPPNGSKTRWGEGSKCYPLTGAYNSQSPAHTERAWDLVRNPYNKSRERAFHSSPFPALFFYAFDERIQKLQLLLRPAVQQFDTLGDGAGMNIGCPNEIL